MVPVVNSDTGTRVDRYLETGGRLLGVGAIVAGFGVLAWGFQEGNLVRLAVGVVLVLFGLTFLVFPGAAWEMLWHLLWFV